VIAGLALAFVTANGCTRRITVTPAELVKLDVHQKERDLLRVFPDRRALAVYETPKKNEAFDVDREVDETNRRRRVRIVLTRNTGGLVVDEDTSNGQPRLWVSFEPDCLQRECAWEFVLSEVEHEGFFLKSYPDKDGYRKRVHRRTGTKRNRLRPGRYESLAEPNEILLRKLKPKWRKAKGVYLILKKRERDLLERENRRLRGVP
jgi:hypothetical protein